MSIHSAAVLPFSNYHGDRYCFLAVENRGVLSTFGGGCHAAEKPHHAGAREYSEESLDVFGKASPHKLKHARQCKTGNHITYFLNTDIHSFNPVKKFDTIRKAKFKKLKSTQREIKKIIAVKKQTLIDGIKTGQTRFQGYNLRMCLVHSLTDAYNKGVLQKA